VFGYLCHSIKTTHDSVRVMLDKELPELLSRIQGDSPEDDLARLCQEIDRGSPWLGKAVRAGGVALVNTYHDSYYNVPEELWSLFWVWGVLCRYCWCFALSTVSLKPRTWLRVWE
jgi:hypothetical protein